jgi:hypothetical protein
MKLNKKFIAVPAIALAAGISLSACGTTVVQPPPKVNINNNNNAAPAPTTPAPVVVAPAPVAVVPAAGEYSNSQTLYDALASEQQSELAAAPSYDYYSPGNISVTDSCTETYSGSGVYNCTGSDTDGDTGYGDTVTVLDNGNAWSDTGMNWTGPDVYIDGGVTNYWTTPAYSS